MLRCFGFVEIFFFHMLGYLNCSFVKYTFGTLNLIAHFTKDLPLGLGILLRYFQASALWYVSPLFLFWPQEFFQDEFSLFLIILYTGARPNSLLQSNLYLCLPYYRWIILMMQSNRYINHSENSTYVMQLMSAYSRTGKIFIKLLCHIERYLYKVSVLNFNLVKEQN